MGKHAWSSVLWQKMAVASGVTVDQKNIKFSKAGVYQISIAYRPGSGADVWTSARCFDGAKSVGHAVGHGHPANDPAVITLVWLCNVKDTSRTYQLQIGRHADVLKVHPTPNTISGQTLPSYQATIELVTQNYAQFEAKGQTTKAKSWDKINFNSSPVYKDIHLGSNGAIKFKNPGVYQVCQKHSLSLSLSLSV